MLHADEIYSEEIQQLQDDLIEAWDQLEALLMHNSLLKDALYSAGCFVDKYVDVKDGEDGPVPNEAMILLNEMACAYYDCDEYDLIGVNWLDKEAAK